MGTGPVQRGCGEGRDGVGVFGGKGAISVFLASEVRAAAFPVLW